MKDILLQINRVEGVVGSYLFTMRGDILSNVLPPETGNDVMHHVSRLVLDCLRGLQSEETLESLEFRYTDGRIIVKSCSGVLLCIFCSKIVNIHMLTLTLNVVVKKLHRLAEELPPPPEITSPPPSPAERADDGSTLRLTVANLTSKSASSSFDSLGMIAVNRSTAHTISEFYATEVRNLALSNADAGIHGVFHVMTINDLGSAYDNSIVVGPSVGKKLMVEKGDLLEVTIG